MPYTYLIGWSQYRKFYYGSSYRKGCDPSDLWTKYFTSSKSVARLRAIYGEPDIIQIRRTFETAEQARRWEVKVLRRMNAVKREDFLNLRNPGGTGDDFLRSRGRVVWNKGKTGVQINPYKGVTGRYTDEQRKIISIRTKESMAKMDKARYEKRDSCNGRRWMNKDGRHKRVRVEDVSSFVDQGWMEGRLIVRNDKGQIIKVKHDIQS